MYTTTNNGNYEFTISYVAIQEPGIKEPRQNKRTMSYALQYE